MKKCISFNELGDSKSKMLELDSLSSHENNVYENTDDVLETLGEFNQRTKIVTALVLLFSFVLSWNELAYLFYGLDSPWYCTGEVRTNESSCMFNSTISFQNKQFRSRCNFNRSEWEFERDKYFSMVTEYDLVCKRKHIVQLLLYFTPCGRLLGFIPAALCDVYGRKPILFLSTFMMGISNVIGYFARDFALIVITLLATNMFQIGIIVSGYLIVTEIVGPKKRSFASNSFWAVYPASNCLLSLVAYLIPFWRTIRLVMGIPSFLLLFLWRFIPESPRWLHVCGRVDESEKVLSQLTGINSKSIKLQEIVAVRQKSIKDILLKRSLIKKHLFFTLLNFCMAIVFFGVSLSATFLSGNFYMDFALISIVGIPANVLSIYLCNRFGRKLSSIVPLWFCCGFLIAIAALPTDYAIARSILGVNAKFFIAIGFNSEYLLACETYPTCVRSQAVCILSFGVLIGNACSPWLVLGLESIAPFIPFALMAVVAALTALLCHFMVETNGKPTLEVFD